MISYKINVQDDERFTRISGGTLSFYVILGLMFLTLQVMLIRPFLMHWTANKGDLLMLVLMECLFGVIFYVVGSWCPFYFSFVKDKQKGRLIFFAVPGCWRKKSYSLLGVSGLLVEDRGDWLARVYVVEGKKHIIFSGYLELAKEIASKAGEAFNLKVEYQ
ncbi:hypothetical protein J7M23_03015 [Candidatus Sumerlaeota bacterium]|nr:hypothetical protein [Candidatus Sumerlaeota bacterium]